MDLKTLLTSLKEKHSEEKLAQTSLWLKENDLTYDEFHNFLLRRLNLRDADFRFALVKKWLETTSHKEEFTCLAFSDLFFKDYEKGGELVGLNIDKACELFKMSLMAAPQDYLHKGWKIVGIFRDSLSEASAAQRTDIIVDIWKKQDAGNILSAKEINEIYKPFEPPSAEEIAFQKKVEEAKKNEAARVIIEAARVAEEARIAAEIAAEEARVAAEIGPELESIDMDPPNIVVGGSATSKSLKSSDTTKNAGATSS